MRRASTIFLDVGCGGGLFAEALAGLGCRVTGIDPSAASIDEAVAHAGQAGLDVRYVVGSGEQLPFDAGSYEELGRQMAFRLGGPLWMNYIGHGTRR